MTLAKNTVGQLGGIQTPSHQDSRRMFFHHASTAAKLFWTISFYGVMLMVSGNCSLKIRPTQDHPRRAQNISHFNNRSSLRR